MLIKPALKQRKVVVIGGGPAGLETAWIAAARGHVVILYEKQPVLGGQFRIAAIPPFKQDIAKAVAYYIHMCKKHGVLFKLGTEATVEQIVGEEPDVVVLATGGEIIIPDLKGATGARVVNAWELLEGKKPVGDRVLVVGGGMIGCEVADFLGEHLHQVTVVDMLPEIASDVPPPIKVFLLQRLKDYEVKIETETSVVEFLDDGVVVKKDGRIEERKGFDTIVLALGTKSNAELKEPLEARISEVYVIGDALKPRKAIEAVEEGARLALML